MQKQRKDPPAKKVAKEVNGNDEAPETAVEDDKAEHVEKTETVAVEVETTTETAVEATTTETSSESIKKEDGKEEEATDNNETTATTTIAVTTEAVPAVPAAVAEETEAPTNITTTAIETEIQTVSDTTSQPPTLAPAGVPSGVPGLGVPIGVPGMNAKAEDTANANQPAASPSKSTVTPQPQAPPTTTSASNAIITEKGEVAMHYVGRVIGKGGEQIRDLQARSGCKIDVDQNVPDGAPRVLTYQGSRKAIDFAKQLVGILCSTGGKDTDLPLGEATRKQLQVPATSIGKIIGRGGEMIKELQSKR